MEEVGGVVDRALYGGKKGGQQGFGNALYEIKEEKRKGCNYKAEVATFYKDYLVIRNAQQQGCLPMRYEETVMPKYRLCGARISRGANFNLLALGVWLIVVGAALIGSDTGFKSGGGYAGIIFAIIGAALLLTPLCLVYYVTELQVICDPDDPASPACGYVSYYLRTFQKPDDDFVLLYVYGSLNENMHGYHSLSHLIDDSLVAKVKPRMMTSIGIDAEALPDSGILEPKDGGNKSRRASHSNNTGFGKQMYILEQEAGLFGEAGGPCKQIAPIKNVVKACFCEQLLVVQNEQKILCYPRGFEKFVVPKYKIASVNFRKGGAYSTLFLGQVLSVVGFFVLAFGLINKNGFFALGIALVVIGLAVVIFTLCKSVYSVDLIMQKKPVPKGERLDQMFLRSLMNKMLGPDTVTLTLAKEPDRDFIMSYVFGTLGSNMGGYHALTHLVKDHLVDRPEPRTIMGAIASTGLQAFTPTSMGTFDHGDHGETNAKMSDNV
jgi:uncharacterized membrane protein YeaQ/YmgE (transglycosylase-associated protein family)